MSIITYPLNGVVYSAEDVATYLCTRTSGVYSKETNFAVSTTGTRQITVAPGLAWINYDDFKGVSVCSREENVLTVPEADNTLNRVDRVVLQFDTSENITAIKLKTGTPAVAAQPPDILQNHNQYELGLCTISVPAGSTAVTAADITDTRADETVCGVMRDGVHGIPTGTLVQQFRAVILLLYKGRYRHAALGPQLRRVSRGQHLPEHRPHQPRRTVRRQLGGDRVRASADGRVQHPRSRQHC